MNNVIRLDSNKNGRDLLASDIHGAFNTLIKALKLANFDPAVDRLFINGDLIDRGAHSYRVSEFLSFPWLKALAGNHERMLLELYAHGEPNAFDMEQALKANGFGWWQHETQASRYAILDSIRPLPLVYEIQTPTRKVGLVHADVPSDWDWPTFISHIEAGHPYAELFATWSRERVQAVNFRKEKVNGGKPNTRGIEGIDRVFIGHCVVREGMLKLGNVYAIDTGAVFHEQGTPNRRITLVDLDASDEVLCRPNEVEPGFDIRI